jgi:hypothetical protein
MCRVCGACELCGERRAKGECRVCGRLACEEHLAGGLCYACREALCSICSERLSLGRCSICSRLVCWECSVQVDPVRRVCKECLAAGLRSSPRRQGAARMARLAARILG